MRTEYKSLSVFVLMASLLSACGSSSVKNDQSGSVAEQKAEQKADRAALTAERRVDQHTDHKINRAVDRLFRKL